MRRNRNKKKSTVVSSVIPQSRLSTYGNYCYNDEREAQYVQDVDGDDIAPYSICTEDNEENKSKEPWMHPDVEECFTRLKSKPMTSEVLNIFLRYFRSEDPSIKLYDMLQIWNLVYVVENFKNGSQNLENEIFLDHLNNSNYHVFAIFKVVYLRNLNSHVFSIFKV